MSPAPSSLAMHDDDATRIWRAGIAAVGGGQATASALRGRVDHQFAAELAGLLRPPVLLAIGKAAAAMMAGAIGVLGPVPRALVVTKHGHADPGLAVRQLEAGHPVPDAAGLAAVAAVEDLIGSLDDADLLLVLLSGGASALLPAPLPGLELADLQALTDLLLGAGLAIDAVNTVRGRLSRLAGGGLARRAAPARVRTLAIVDVPDGDPLTVGSGPTVADPTPPERALALIDAAGLREHLPERVLRVLSTPPGDAADTPVDSRWYAIADNAQAIAAATAAAGAAGWTVHRGAALEGPAATAGSALAGRLRSLPPGSCLIAGGETTVDLPVEHGLGGRNQHLALAAARVLDGGPPALLLAAGSDGSDGPTAVAGARVDQHSWARALAAGLDPEQSLRRCDAHHLLTAIGATFSSGPTGTNVMDLVVGCRPSASDRA